VQRARSSYARRAWGEACAGLLPHMESLEAKDLERLAVSAYLVGREDESDGAWARAHRLRLAGGDVEGAARCAFWIGFRLVNAHDAARANGWIAQLERLAQHLSADSLARARLAYLTGLRSLFEGGSFEKARAHLDRAEALAGGRRVSAYVNFAETVAVAKQDRKEFDALLRRALEVDPDAVPDMRLAPLVYQKRARWLLGRTDELFVE